jgi:hypothetical protein
MKWKQKNLRNLCLPTRNRADKIKLHNHPTYGSGRKK